MLLVSEAKRKVAITFRSDLASIVPHVRGYIAGVDAMVVDHTPDVVKVCQTFGVDIPAPILSHYDFPGMTPFEVQKRTAALLSTEKRAFVLNGMGTGKTVSAIWAWHYLWGNGYAKRCLVVAPLSTLRFTWQREFFRTVPDVKVGVLHGTREKRLALLKEPFDVFIVNHDGLALIEANLPDDIDTLVLDELSVYRNGSAKRSKIARAVAKRMEWVWGMTGSPIPNEPTDAWAQCRIINPSRVPEYFGRFRDATMKKVSQFKWVQKPDALDTVYNAMQPAVRFTLEDVIELPDVIHRVIDVEMGTKQAKLYEAMASKAHALVDKHEITAMNAGVVMNKLLQIACGYVYSNERDIVELDNNERISALLDVIEATNEKVLVFVPFKHTVAGISRALKTAGIEHACITGDVTAAERAATFNLFQNTSKYKAIVAHPATMSHGLTLTAASTVVWFAPILSLETWEQANARVRRIGQKAKQQVIMLQSTKVEKKIYKNLEHKQNVQDKLLEMFEVE